MRNALRQVIRPKKHDIEALVEFDLQIRPGESVGLMGPNGAGKSTAVKLFSGVLVPSAGAVFVDNLDPARQRQRNAKNIGVVFGQRTGLLWDIPVNESFALARRLYDMEEDAYSRSRDLLFDALDLSDYSDQPVRTLSLGQRVKADLALALLHSPKIAFLDEPTIGLDVEVKAQVRSLLKSITEGSDTAILLTTHDVRDIEAVCERIVIVNRGRKIFDGSRRSLMQRLGNWRELDIKVDNARTASNVLDLPTGAVIVRETQDSIRIDFDSQRITAPDLIRTLCLSASSYRLND